MARTTRALVNLTALIHNAKRVRQFAPHAKLMSVVKANAYGHGCAKVAEALYPHSDAFAVATVEEGINLRESLGEQRGFKPITVLSDFTCRDEVGALSASHLSAVIYDPAQLDLLNNQSAMIDIWIEINTGMNRAGINADDLEDILNRTASMPNVRVLGLMSHFACADDPEHPLNNAQLIRFQNHVRRVASRRRLTLTMANSAAVVGQPDSHFDFVRPGIMLYGVSPVAGKTAADLGLLPVMSLRASIIGLRTVAETESVGYGATWASDSTRRIALVNCGYGDGYPCRVASGSPVAVGGATATTVGRVSMDSLSVDVTGLDNVAYGDDVELWGERVSISVVAEAAGTIAYEPLTQVAARVPRVYLTAGDGDER